MEFILNLKHVFFRRSFVRKFCDCNRKRGLILGVYDGDPCEPCFTPSAYKYNEEMGGKLKDLIMQSGGEVQSGQCKLFNNVDCNFWSIGVVGLGPKDVGYCERETLDKDRENVRIATAVGAKKLAKQGCNTICIDGMGYPEQAAEGAGLAVWRFQDYKLRDHWKDVPTLELFDDPDQESWQRGLFKADSQNLTRRYCEIPANLMTPQYFTSMTVCELRPCGIRVDIYDKLWIESKHMNAFLTVSKGSCTPPMFLEVQYCGGSVEDKCVLLIGKGLTYDTGGICLKQCDYRGRHRADMAGAALIVSTMRAASALSLPINLVGLIPLCENMSSGMAMKCGDVVVVNGKTVRIDNTDNEGRLMLSDALVYAQQNHKPSLIIDISTESKSATAALGSGATAVFTNSHSIWNELKKAGAYTGDRMWRMPLWKYYTRNVTKSPGVDLSNTGHGYGDCCLAAAFLQEFVNCVDWVHMDINGVGMNCQDRAFPYLRKGCMTGRPSRTLIQFLYQLACPMTKSIHLNSLPC